MIPNELKFQAQSSLIFLISNWIRIDMVVNPFTMLSKNFFFYLYLYKNLNSKIKFLNSNKKVEINVRIF